MMLALACFFPGQARAASSSSPPAASRILVLHLDNEVGDDGASGLSWDEPLRSLAEVQRRMEAGARVAALRLSAGWHPGTLRTDRPLRIEGGYPPAGHPRDGMAAVRGAPEEHRTVLDGLGRGPVVAVEGADLSLEGLVLRGGWSLEGGAIALSGGSVTARRVELLDSGPALIGCRDCRRIKLSEVVMRGGMTAAVDLRGTRRTELHWREVEVDAIRHGLLAESPVDLELRGADFGSVEAEPFLLPEGSTKLLVRVRGLPAEPAESTESTESTEPTEPTKPTKPTKPTETAEPRGTGEPADPAGAFVGPTGLSECPSATSAAAATARPAASRRAGDR